MAGRGRPPTPTAILKLRGSRWADRPNEPQPKAEAPRCPVGMNAAAKRVWQALVPQLHELGMLAHFDDAVLEQHCTNVARRRVLMKQLAKEGETMETNKGFIIKNPLVGIISKLDDAIRRTACEFGMTPASRTRIHVKATTKTPADDLSEFVKSKNA